MLAWLWRWLGYNTSVTTLGNLRPTPSLTLDKKQVAKTKLQEVKRKVNRQSTTGFYVD